MSIGHGLKWISLAVAGVALSGCVAAAPGAYGPVAYDDGYVAPGAVYSEPSQVYYDPYYVDGGYDPYYAPVYPTVGTSIQYNVYSDRRRGNSYSNRRRDVRPANVINRRGERRDRVVNRNAERRADIRAERQARRDAEVGAATPAERRIIRQERQTRNQRPRQAVSNAAIQAQEADALEWFLRNGRSSD